MSDWWLNCLLLAARQRIHGVIAMSDQQNDPADMPVDKEKAAQLIWLKKLLKQRGLEANACDVNQLARELAEATGMSDGSAFDLIEEVLGQCLVEIMGDARDGKFGGH